MDLDLLKTFVEVSRTRHFGQAADNLFVTQSAISARVRLLEQILGTALLSRTRGNIQPTPAGHKLLKHAELMLDAWNRARMDITIEEGSMIPLTVGAVPNIWDSLLQEWVQQLHKDMPDVSITAELHSAESLLQRLHQGTLDVAFLFESSGEEAIESHELGAMPLVMVSTTPEITVEQAFGSGYVIADWGSRFATTHSREYPDSPSPIARFSLGSQAYEFILNCGGSAYLAEPLIQDDLGAGRLHRVTDAVTMTRVAYACISPTSAQLTLVKKTLRLIDLD